MSNGVSQFVTMELPDAVAFTSAPTFMIAFVPSFERYNQTTRPTGEQWLNTSEKKGYC
jgi:hypothetical protein